MWVDQHRVWVDQYRMWADQYRMWADQHRRYNVAALCAWCIAALISEQRKIRVERGGAAGGDKTENRSIAMCNWT